VEIVRKWLLDIQANIERCASELELAPEITDACRRSSEKLRQLAQSPYGTEVQGIFAARERSEARFIAQLEWDMSNTGPPIPRADWCGVADVKYISPPATIGLPHRPGS
jgi:hypothetical protein